MANGSDIHCGRTCAICQPASAYIPFRHDMDPLIKQASPDEYILARRIKRGVYAYFETELHKRCVKCKEYWPADTEFFYDSKAHNDGISDTCRACSCEQRQHYRTQSSPNRMVAA